jgi:hypothetical protein
LRKRETLEYCENITDIDAGNIAGWIFADEKKGIGMKA